MLITLLKSNKEINFTLYKLSFNRFLTVLIKVRKVYAILLSDL